MYHSVFRRPGAVFTLILSAGLSSALILALQQPANLQERFRAMSREAEDSGLKEPYRGITSGGEIEAGLFRIRSTGVSTEPVRRAAESFIATMTEEQKKTTLFSVDDPEWRKWMNQHFYDRQGLGLIDMTAAQRETAFHLLAESLSARGLRKSRNIMRLDTAMAELRNNFEEYGEDRYYFTIMGRPSATEPWGWQLDGHHLIVNYFVLGDQVVMTPTFMGSEPVMAEWGKYKGVSVMQEEQNKGLQLVRALSRQQQAEAILEVSKTGNNNLGEAFRDNFDLEYAGTPVSGFTAGQKELLRDLIAEYIDNMDEGHARVRMEEIENSFDRTWFAWIGGTQDESVFYYRVHSPVVLIEFDHQRPVGMRDQFPEGQPNRQHIHSVVRTPNGNDYGKDLLRLHYQEHPHNH